MRCAKLIPSLLNSRCFSSIILLMSDWCRIPKWAKIDGIMTWAYFVFDFAAPVTPHPRESGASESMNDHASLTVIRSTEPAALSNAAAIRCMEWAAGYLPCSEEWIGRGSCCNLCAAISGRSHIIHHHRKIQPTPDQPMGLGACDEKVTGPLFTGIYKGR